MNDVLNKILIHYNPKKEAGTIGRPGFIILKGIDFLNSCNWFQFV